MFIKNNKNNKTNIKNNQQKNSLKLKLKHPVIASTFPEKDLLELDALKKLNKQLQEENTKLKEKVIILDKIAKHYMIS